MAKRKRPIEDTLEAKLPDYRIELFRVLKKVKGFERQRQSKHLHQADTEPAKRQRLEKEVAVLKSLDLHQTANHYLSSTLTRIKSLANHPNFPDELRNPSGPKPNLSDEERAALHHVTSCLFNQPDVKDVIERIVDEACGLLEVPMPEKKRGKRKRAKDYVVVNGDEGGELEVPRQPKTGQDGPIRSKRVGSAGAETQQSGSPVGVTSKKGVASKSKKTQPDRVEEAEQKILDMFDNRLGGSSDGEDLPDSDSEDEGARIIKGRSIHARNVPDPNSSDSEDGEDVKDDEDIDDRGQQIGNGRSIHVRGLSVSLSPEPEPTPRERRTEKPVAGKKVRQPREPAKDSRFLPTLMGGYISGSESASDVEMEIAPRKNRLGQRQRQLRAEKKHGANAKHLTRQRMRRDDGWDMKRGAVAEEDDGRTPWKKSINNPLATNSKIGQEKPTVRPSETSKLPKKAPPREDDAPLHPSWAARMKMKENAPKITISKEPTNANKIVFDD